MIRKFSKEELEILIITDPNTGESTLQSKKKCPPINTIPQGLTEKEFEKRLIEIGFTEKVGWIISWPSKEFNWITEYLFHDNEIDYYIFDTLKSAKEHLKNNENLNFVKYPKFLYYTYCIECGEKHYIESSEFTILNLENKYYRYPSKCNKGCSIKTETNKSIKLLR